MFARRAAAFSLAAVVFLGGPTLAQAQARFGKPVAVEIAPVPQKSQVPSPQGLKETASVAVDNAPVPQKPPIPSPQGPKEAKPDEFGLTPPTRDQLFRVQSEQALKERLRQELPKVKKVDFPKEGTPLPEVPDADVAPFPEQVISPIAGQVCYRPLYFEDKRAERFGLYVPCVQPLVSAGRFYGNALILPYRIWQAPPWTYECDNR